jgi:hypothetical protein
MITDKLASYAAAEKDLMPSVEHRRRKELTNRAENSHQPTRRRERQMKRFKSAGQAQRSCRRTIRLTTSFLFAAITSPPTNIELHWPRPSASRPRSLASRRRLRDAGHHRPRSPHRINLTVPLYL